MENYDFKGNLTSDVFRLMGRTWFPTFLWSLIYTAVIGGVAFLLLKDVAPQFEGFAELVQENAQDPQLNSIVMGELGEIFMNNIGSMLPVFLLMIFLGLLSYNFSFSLISNEVRTENNSFSSALSKLFDKRLLQYFLVLLIIGGIYNLLNGLVQSSNSVMLSLAFSLIVGPVYYWFHISYASVGLGNSSAIDGLRLSSSQMSFSRIAKTLGISILITIVAGIAFLIGGLLAALVANIPMLGIPLAAGLIMLVLAVVMAFVFSGLSGLYFRYSDSEKLEEEFLVTD